MVSLIIANWKMNFTPEESINFCNNIVNQIDNSTTTNKLLIAPPIPYIAYLAQKFQSLSFCAQNVSVHEGYGAYTGEYSSRILKNSGIDYCLVGHSERRELLGESNDMVKSKVQNCLNVDITPIICIGEPIEVRQHGKHKDFLRRQIIESIPSTKKKLIIAYEPLWAIGSGMTPSISELKETFGVINSITGNTRLIYGGSVNQSNIDRILDLPDVGGVLVGKAALNYKSLIRMLSVNI